MTDTPETDAMWCAYDRGDADDADLANLMIGLERARDEARKEAERWRDRHESFLPWSQNEITLGGIIMEESGICKLGKTKDGKLHIMECQELFVCSRDAIQDIILMHNELISKRNEARAEADRCRHILARENNKINVTFAWENN